MANSSSITTGSAPRLLQDGKKKSTIKDKEDKSMKVTCSTCNKTLTFKQLKGHSCSGYQTLNLKME